MGLQPEDLLMPTVEKGMHVLKRVRENFLRTKKVVEELMQGYSHQDTSECRLVTKDAAVHQMLPGLCMHKLHESQKDGNWWTLFPSRKLTAGQEELVRLIWTQVYAEQAWCISV
jgi:hypothetical protein